MLSRKDLVFPILVLILFASVTFFFLMTYGKDFLKYSSFKNKGVNTHAVVAGKKEIQNLNFTNIFTGYRSSIYQLIAAYNAGNEIKTCKLSVSKITYDALGIRDEFELVYIPSSPADCTLPSSLHFNYYVILTVCIAGVLFLFITSGFAFYIYRSFKRPPTNKPVSTTTLLELDNIDCPKCGKSMNEGYLPTIGGVSWRTKEEPVGMPTILSGLPGTTFWIKRPRLHAFHCDGCRIIIFKYGNS